MHAPGGDGVTLLPGSLTNARLPHARWRVAALANAPVAVNTQVVEGPRQPSTSWRRRCHDTSPALARTPTPFSPGAGVSNPTDALGNAASSVGFGTIGAVTVAVDGSIGG